MHINEAVKKEREDFILRLISKVKSISYLREPELLYIVSYDINTQDSSTNNVPSFDYNLANEIIERVFTKPIHVLRSTWLLPFDGESAVLYKKWKLIFDEIIKNQAVHRNIYIVVAALVDLNGDYNTDITDINKKIWKLVEEYASHVHNSKYVVRTGLEDL